MKLKPKNAEVYLVYECPSCKCEWLQTPKHVIKLKGMVCDNCDTYVEFEPISGVNVVPMYTREATKNTPIEKKSKELTVAQTEAIEALVSVGVNKKEVVDFVSRNELSNAEDYIRLYFRQ